jgi:peroxiredoxin Q/BCP
MKIGDVIPEFKLKDQSGKTVTVTPYDRQKKIIYFYTSDNRANCIKQACMFRDQYEIFTRQGYQIYGISADPVASHRKFADRHKIKYPLLSDPGNLVRRLFRAQTFFGLLPGRATFAVDIRGKIFYKHDTLIDVQNHVKEVLNSVSFVKTEALAI